MPTFDSTYKELKLNGTHLPFTGVLTFDSTYKELKHLLYLLLYLCC